MEISKKLKGKVIGKYAPDLWKSNFIHLWQKPDCISEIEFLEEKKIFEKSISFKYQKFQKLKSEISEELSKIGELSTYIIQGGKEESKKYLDNLMNDLLNFLYPAAKSQTYNKPVAYEPIKKGKKVGRNEPCPCGSGKKYKKCCGKN